jgi:hypothetical protein
MAHMLQQHSFGQPVHSNAVDMARPGAPHQRRKGAPAGQSLLHVPEMPLLASREDDRPQDMGHIPVEGEMPPPDYGQATERYDL